MLALRTARAVLALALVVALALLVLHALPGDGPTWLPGLVPSVLLVLVTGIGALVSAYAVTNLQGQRRLARFAALEVVAVAGLALAVLSPHLVLLAVGWTAGGLAVAALVGHDGGEQSRAASQAVRLRLLAGDAALWAAVIVVGAGLHTWQVAELPGAVATGSTPWVVLAAVLVVVAGAARSALVPAHRWLPETAAAPSPVSALLHAGLANGVGVLALLLWPVVMASAWARGLLLVAAVATVALGTAQLRTRPDVKGRLAASTSAQMGYLGVQVAIGLPAAVLAHLVGHGLWKASLFLGAGGTVSRERGTAPVAGAPRSRALALAGDVALGAGLVLLLAQVPLPWGPALLEGPAALVPVAVASLAAVVAVRSARLSGHGRRSAAAGVVLLAVSAYVLALRWLTPVVDAEVAPATPRWGEPGAVLVLAVVLALAALVVVGWRVDRAASRGLR
ncbi:MAG: proton-conducting transporter membrane subunit, partial [Candidatus Nanopelagicales bacterium]